MITFFGLVTSDLICDAFEWKTTRRVRGSSYGSQRSTMTHCGLGGILGMRSMITLRGGGGKRLPAMTIRFGLVIGGAFGGCSRYTSGSGVFGRFGIWRMIIGGAGLNVVFAS